MTVFNNVVEFIKERKLICAGDKVGIGVSGGADSMFLLFTLFKAQKELGIDKLVCVHFNHNLRGKESDLDENFVANFCSQNKISFVSSKQDVKDYCKINKVGVEEGARILRYEYFEEIIKEFNLDKFCLAHHKNDQVETVLMHIFRGSGLSGAVGMLAQQQKYIRPLLCITKNQIMESIKQYDLKFRIDKSNKNIKYTRNYIRNKLIPNIEKYYPNCIDAIFSFSNACEQDENYILESLPKNYVVYSNNEIKLLDKCLSLPKSLQFRLIRDAFQRLGAYKDIETKHFEFVCDLFSQKKGNKLYFPFAIMGFRDYDGVTLTINKSNKVELSCNFEVPQILDFANVEITTCFLKKPVIFQNGIHTVDFMKIPDNAIWRTKNDGDVFSNLNCGSKKLSDYFTNKKIPQRIRKDIPLLASGKEILVIAGEAISDKIKIDDTTETVVEIKYKRKGSK